MIWEILLGVALFGASTVNANLALGKPATQRDDYGASGWVAGKAVDGNPDGNIYNNACQHTSEVAAAGPAWWQVDLQESFAIDSVTIYNRVDCCGHRLEETHVLVSDSESFDGAAVCGYIGSEGNSAVVTVGCTGQPMGRYVTLLRDDSAPQFQIMNICEVEVFGFSDNLALGKSATQRDDYGASGWVAGKAVDGNPDGNIYNNACQHTSEVAAAGPAWWQVDLGAAYSIYSVTVYNRVDCCGHRLEDTYVLVSDSESFADATECAFIGSEGSGAVVTAECAAQPVGRYVTLLRDESAPQSHIMNICEVEVAGGA